MKTLRVVLGWEVLLLSTIMQSCHKGQLSYVFLGRLFSSQQVISVFILLPVTDNCLRRE